MTIAMIIWIVAAVASIALVIFVRGVRDRLASMTTAIWLLVIVALLSMAGTMIGQNLPRAAYVERFGAPAGGFLVASGLTNVFGSWYFLFFVGALALSLLTCSFVRIARLVRPARTARLAKLGSLITHLSIVVVLVGGLITALAGFRYPASHFLEAGDVLDVPEGGFSLRVDEARTEFTDDGVISEYVSVVTVLEEGREVFSRRIEVNHPLVHRGLGIYQYEMMPSATSVASAMLGVVVTTPDGDERLAEIAVVPGEDAPVPGTAITLKILEFMSHFTYDIARGTAELASVRHENPAVLVQVAEEGEPVGETWAFAAFPGHEPERELPCRVFLLDYRPDHENALTRFEFSSQPGTPLLFAGFAAMSVGLCLTFWTRRPAGASGDLPRPGASRSEGGPDPAPERKREAR